jgi:hypothetical protein
MLLPHTHQFSMLLHTLTCRLAAAEQHRPCHLQLQHAQFQPTIQPCSVSIQRHSGTRSFTCSIIQYAPPTGTHLPIQYAPPCTPPTCSPIRYALPSPHMLANSVCSSHMLANSVCSSTHTLITQQQQNGAGLATCSAPRFQLTK